MKMWRRHWKRGQDRQRQILTLVLTSLTVRWTRGQDPGPAPPPNILLIMADDLGYGDLGCFGNSTLRTPHLDRLASEGVKLTHSLAAASVCSPSRAAFLTGRYPVRSGMAPTSFVRVSFLTASNNGLHVTELTVSKVAKTAGYTTALLGKWHLGWSVDRSDPHHHHPLNHGFDYFYGIPLTLVKDFDPREVKVWREHPDATICTISLTSITLMVCTCMLLRREGHGRAMRAVMVGIVVVTVLILAVTGLVALLLENLTLLNSFFYRNYEIVEQPIQLPRVTRKLVTEATQFLEKRHHDRQPFLLFLSWLHVHTALATGPAFRDSSAHGPYGDAVEEMDWGVGEVLAALDRLGLGENTLVYFTSDNGGHVEEKDFAGRQAGGWNGVLKGGKGHGAPDGGIRMPTILRWPSQVPAGSVIDEPVSLMDVLPTVAGVLRVPLPDDLVIDGRDLLPLVKGEVEVSPHEFLFHYCQNEVHAVRYRPQHGNVTWKLVLYEPDYNPGTQHCRFLCLCSQAKVLHPPALFDLASDPGERRPLFPADLPEYQALAERMLGALERHKRSVAPVENMYSWDKIVWRPWKQPVCRFPHFQCHDPKFAGLFEDEGE